MAKILIVHGMNMHLFEEGTLAPAWAYLLAAAIRRVAAEPLGRDEQGEQAEGAEPAANSRFQRAPVVEPADIDLAFWGDLYFDPRKDKRGAEGRFALPGDQQVRAAVYAACRVAVRATDWFAHFDEEGNPTSFWGRRFHKQVTQTVLFMQPRGVLPTDGRSVHEEVLQRVRAKLALRPQVVIGHSLGSVIAYEALREAGPESGVETFLTIGSPMATPELILKPLRARVPAEASGKMPAPPGVKQWFNICTTADVWCVPVPRLKPIFELVEDEIVDTPKGEIVDPTGTHRFDNYLHNVDVARWLATHLGDPPVPHTADSVPPDLEPQLRQLEKAAAELDETTAREASERLVTISWGQTASELRNTGPSTFRRVRGTRQFRALEDISLAVLARGIVTPWAHTALIQALIDQGKLEAADHALAHALSAHPGDVELRGLEGRLHKQRFVRAIGMGAKATESLARNPLVRAFTAYAGVYRSDTSQFFHGINAVALAYRAAREGVALPGAFDPVAASNAIRDYLQASGGQEHWVEATLLECAVARNDLKDALGHAGLYARNPAADAFAFASTLRQLREIWQLDESDPDAQMLTFVLEAHGPLDGRGGSAFARKRAPTEEQLTTFAAQAEDRRARSRKHDRSSAPSGLEANFGGLIVALRKFSDGLRSAEAVASLMLPHSASVIGTGFVVPGNELCPSLGPDPVLVTNGHVLSDLDAHPAPLRPKSTRVAFEVGPNHDETFELQEPLVWVSPWHECDAAIARFVKPPSLSPLRHTATVPEMRDHVYVVGHSGGGSLAISLMDNVLLAKNDRLLHYRAPTDRGGSGSPVFDSDWRLIGVHHRGYDALDSLVAGNAPYPGNEGIVLNEIKRQLTAHLAR